MLAKENSLHLLLVLLYLTRSGIVARNYAGVQMHPGEGSEKEVP